MNYIKTLAAVAALGAASAVEARDLYLLNENWRSVCFPEGRQDSMVINDLQLPHNWDDYYGYRQLTHGNLHGRARYERNFSLQGVTREANAMMLAQQHYNLRLEGVGTYVSVWLNGFEVCRHRPAGRVVTDLDITEYLRVGDPRSSNHLIIECEHPSNITDMPWVCGGCSSEWGFSEGSAPFGLFRNVLIEATDQLRIEPFGVHAWANQAKDTVWVDTEVHNYSSHGEECVLQTIVEGKVRKETFKLASKTTYVSHQVFTMKGVDLESWSLENPVLYTVSSTVMHGSQHVVADKVHTKVGFADVKWPERTADGKLSDNDHRFYLNGVPTFVNGTSEYEHLYGQSHALLYDEIDRRCMLVKQMGFNAFRDAHQPHNLRYQEIWEQTGVMWWPQFSAHIWYDTPQFRQNFKTLLRQWVKERRNNPAIILWGLQNESVLPEDFARECADIIREMDPKCARSNRPGAKSTGRLITTCNGGSGTDWNVVQNWSGTYGGNLEQYGEELAKDDQLLNGEYGGWRSYNFHDRQDRQPASAFDPKAPWSEEHLCVLLHRKMQLAYEQRDRVCGQFQWPLFSHDNPGRQQPDEGYRVIDKIGPINYKGLISAFWEPTDAFYLYITWGAYLRGEWPTGMKSPMELSAREMVILGYKHESIPLPDYLLDPESDEAACRPELHKFASKTSLLAPEPDRTYIYRYNCGGDQVTDSYGNVWMGDDTRYCTNWSMLPQYNAGLNLNPVLGSQDFVRGWALDPAQDDGKLLCAKADQALLRSYRFGRHELKFSFPLPVGRVVQVDMWFVNTRHYAYHVSYKTRVGLEGKLDITFPRVKIGQAKVSCIAISMDRSMAREYGKDDRLGFFKFKEGILNPSHPAVANAQGYPYSAGLTWAQLVSQTVEKTDKSTLPADQSSRPTTAFKVGADGAFAIEMGLAQEYAMRFRYKSVQASAQGHWQLKAAQDGRLVCEGDITFPQTPDKLKVVSTTTGGFVNAGQYRLTVTGANGVELDSVEIQ